jgi:hypothetical protein
LLFRALPVEKPPLADGWWGFFYVAWFGCSQYLIVPFARNSCSRSEQSQQCENLRSAQLFFASLSYPDFRAPVASVFALAWRLRRWLVFLVPFSQWLFIQSERGNHESRGHQQTRRRQSIQTTLRQLYRR